MSKSLPAIIKETTEIVLALIDGEGLLPVELEIVKEMNALELADKVDKYGFVLDEVDSRIAFVKSKLDQYKDVIAKLERAGESIEARMKFAMEQLGVKELSGAETRFGIAQNPPKVIVDDELIIPNSFFSVPQVKPQLDKKALAEALKAGAIIPGVHVERGTRLTRKLNSSIKKAGA